jgi:hypothetical protein
MALGYFLNENWAVWSVPSLRVSVNVPLLPAQALSVFQT